MQERVWLLLALMMIIPFVVPIILPEPYSWIGMIGMNLLLLVVLRKNFKAMTGKLFGSKSEWICAVCGNKSKNVTCNRCGSKSRKLS